MRLLARVLRLDGTWISYYLSATPLSEIAEREREREGGGGRKAWNLEVETPSGCFLARSSTLGSIVPKHS